MWNFPKEVELTKARELIDTLHITNSKWGLEKQWYSGWIFRGQSDATKPLLPSAWRFADKNPKNSQAINFIQHHKDYAWNYVVGSLQDTVSDYIQEQQHNLSEDKLSKYWVNTVEVLHQAYSEMRSINAFVRMADAAGHTIEFSDFVETEMNKYLVDIDLGGIENDKIWMNKDIIALAQHHGIPTRLLDWTSQPLIAAFFAAENVDVDSATNEAKLAVYAYNQLNDYGRIKIKTVPRSKSAYLHAQSGVFTYDSFADKSYIENGFWPNFENIFINDGDFLRSLVKFTLPTSEAGEVLRLLWLEGISRAHLMPTLDNVASALKKQMYWEEKADPNSYHKTE